MLVAPTCVSEVTDERGTGAAKARAHHVTRPLAECLPLRFAQVLDVGMSIRSEHLKKSLRAPAGQVSDGGRVGPAPDVRGSPGVPEAVSAQREAHLEPAPPQHLAQGVTREGHPVHREEDVIGIAVEEGGTSPANVDCESLRTGGDQRNLSPSVPTLPSADVDGILPLQQVIEQEVTRFR
ncbi:hypothetical protein LCGC14_2193880, partial [marine sediment metagenome]